MNKIYLNYFNKNRKSKMSFPIPLICENKVMWIAIFNNKTFLKKTKVKFLLLLKSLASIEPLIINNLNIYISVNKID